MSDIQEIFQIRNDEWGTPRKFFEELDEEYHFTLDPCANSCRVLKKDCVSIFIDGNGLEYDWGGHRIFCNPPYSKGNFKLWCEKVFVEKDNAQLIVLLAPLRKCSNLYFHDLILEYADLRIIRGRLDFVPLVGQEIATNPSGSALCVIDNREGIGMRREEQNDM